MKTRKTLALFAFALLALGVTAQKAQAQDYNGNCAGVSGWNGQGNATITQSSGNCTISSAVTATGFISITADSGTVTTQALTSGAGNLTITASGNISTQAITAGQHFGATSTGGSITLTGAVVAGNDGGVGNMLIQAATTFKATSTLTTPGGGIEIDAQTAGGNTLFKIGSSTSNGVTGKISATNGVLIVNGNASSTGGITIASGSDINVAAPSATITGLILLNAQNGNLTLTAGTLGNSGAAGQQANGIALLANTVIAGSGTNSTVISANDGSGAAAHYDSLGIAAQTLTITGSGGLRIEANGTGLSSGGRNVSINPQNWLTITSNENLDVLDWIVNVTGTQNAPLTVNGAGPLTLESNGSYDLVQVAGYPITFSNGALTVESMKDSTTQISITNPTNTGNPGILFNNTGAVSINASGVGANNAGGMVTISGDQCSINSTSFAITSNAPSANGNAGTISFSTSKLSVVSSITPTITANGPTSHNGTGGTITLNPGFEMNVKLGSNVGDVSLSATGGTGSGTGNNGGTITVNGGPFVTLDTAQATAINVAAPAANGNGGTINILAESVTFTGSGYALSANSGTTQGNGGTIDIYYYVTDDLNVGTGAGDVQISATGQGTGNGGTVSLTAGNLTVTGADINVSSGTSGNGGSISITGYSGGGTVEIGGTLDASAGSSGDGNGGNITVSSFDVTVDASSTVSANGGGTGDGGTITLTALDTNTPIDLTEGQLLLAEGGGGGTGNGGTVVLPNVGAFDGDTVVNVNPDDEPDDPQIAQVQPSQPQSFSPLAVTLMWSPSNRPDGRRIFGGVTCQQYDITITGGGNGWPTRVWDCANPNKPSATDKIPAAWIASSTQLSSSINQIFPMGTGGDSPTKLYIFASYTDYNKYFTGGGAGAGDGGLTHPYFNDDGSPKNIDIAIFELSGELQNQMLEITAHELGHVIDFWNDGSYSALTGEYIASDETNLNNDSGLSLYDQGHGTLPCSTNDSAPFDGQPGFGSSVQDQAGHVICNESNGTLNEGSGMNSDIATTFSPGVLGSGNPDIFAESFSWYVFTSTLSNPQYNTYFQKTYDGLLANGYFGCVLAIANYAATGNLSFPSGCHAN